MNTAEENQRQARKKHRFHMGCVTRTRTWVTIPPSSPGDRAACDHAGSSTSYSVVADFVFEQLGTFNFMLHYSLYNGSYSLYYQNEKNFKLHSLGEKSNKAACLEIFTQ